jgi:GPI ethanolamine phosphate transferase 3 subunit O
MLPASPGLLLVLWVVGVYLFSRGFFLSRLELPGVSRPYDLSGSPLSGACIDPAASADTFSTAAWGASSPAPYRRLVIIVIDAWRLDFATDRMPALSRLLSAHPDSARLYRGIADAPTVTMQRVKGFTTGSLPTFLDLSSSFASTAITEDNIVDQAVAAARRETRIERDGSALPAAAATSLPPICATHFYGDDTWASLFPTQFSVSAPLPSFDVADLHGVDLGVEARLVPALQAATRAWKARSEPDAGPGCDFRLLVAHMLGVDHIGHRHSPSHPLMQVRRYDVLA